MSRRLLWDLVSLALFAGCLAAAWMLLRHGLWTMVPAHVRPAGVRVA